VVTSRTGTTKYLTNRRKVLRKARDAGLTQCPGWTDTSGQHHPCGRELDWDAHGTPASVEADHIIAPKYGGTDDEDNLTPLCRDCNVRKGDGSRVLAGFADVDMFPMSREW
jgi:5-methylcytosine-specific restriction endonuclease McrA